MFNNLVTYLIQKTTPTSAGTAPAPDCRLRRTIYYRTRRRIRISRRIAGNCTQVKHFAIGRSRQTRERAKAHKLVDAGTLAELCRTCSVIVSICPPEAAEAVAAEVAVCAFAGIYLDANAIAPQKALRIGHLVEASGTLPEPG
jgi:hypothetical protein